MATISSARDWASSPEAWWWIATSKPAFASVRQIVLPILRAPPVTSATPRSDGSVNPTELEIVDGREDGDEGEDDAESQHGMLLFVPPRLKRSGALFKPR
ncbi:hypothetical protein GCM10009081_03740 [Brevundimonas nasdae]